jgi:hypothetical protein
MTTTLTGSMFANLSNPMQRESLRQLFRNVRILILLSLVALSGCVIERAYYRLATVPSPNGHLLADWYQRSAGSSEDRVTIHAPNEAFSRELPYVFEGISADQLKIVWISDTELSITYPSNTIVTKAMAEWKGVRITYREDPHMSRY